MSILVALTLLAAPALGSDSRGCPDPVNYCLTSPNSAGPGALMSWQGTPSLTTNDFLLVASDCPPDQLLMFYYGAGETQVVFGNGWLCASAGGVGVFRFSPLLIDMLGFAVLKVDFTQPPVGGGPGQWLPGNTWYCQGMYRDPAGGGARFNLTDGLRVKVCLPEGEMFPIPAGEFEMGRHVGSGDPDELPIHTVYLDAFHMDVYEVSNQKYADRMTTALKQGRVTVLAGVVHQVGGAGEALFDTASSSIYSHITYHVHRFGVTAGKEDHPMLMISWYGACAYANQWSRDEGLTPCYDETTWACDFAADGYRLPTEAEWEYAARGGEQNPYYMYPWGDTIDGSMANYKHSGDPFEGTPYPRTSPVGYYDGTQSPPGDDMANGYGLHDTSGNVYEWCWDWYASDYYSNSPNDNPTGPSSGSTRGCRGGSWITDPPLLRLANRGSLPPTGRYIHRGFRVVRRP